MEMQQSMSAVNEIEKGQRSTALEHDAETRAVVD